MANIEFILILDYGSQYTQLIARRLREQQVYCEVLPFNLADERIKDPALKGVILSGGPASVRTAGAPRLPRSLASRPSLPILGICYGMQLLAREAGGRIARSGSKEYGPALLSIKKKSKLFAGIPKKIRVWMSHGDRVDKAPRGYSIVGSTQDLLAGVMEDTKGQKFGIQFHPEVSHTQAGTKILKNFALGICRIKDKFTPDSFIKEQIKIIRAKVGRSGVLCGLSGGVDSSVTAALLYRAVGKQLTCLFVDNGLLRLNEASEVSKIFRKRLGRSFRMAKAGPRFLAKLKGITNPESKRKRIGREFIKVFEEEALKTGHHHFLAQGTLYPDVIESVSVRGPSATIKSHHNVGGLPKRMKLQLVEPLRELFKDEVRRIGKALGLPSYLVDRQPFPGPGLAVRILGAVTEEKLDVLRRADAVVRQELEAWPGHKKVWQYFAVLLPVRTVGVMGDERTYANTVAIRCIDSQDGMTADWSRIPQDLLARLSNRIINEVAEINRVVYDISSKPPATVEWE